jgi:hypothetical protein
MHESGLFSNMDPKAADSKIYTGGAICPVMSTKIAEDCGWLGAMKEGTHHKRRLPQNQG